MGSKVLSKRLSLTIRMKLPVLGRSVSPWRLGNCLTIVPMEVLVGRCRSNSFNINKT